MIPRLALFALPSEVADAIAYRGKRDTYGPQCTVQCDAATATKLLAQVEAAAAQANGSRPLFERTAAIIRIAIAEATPKPDPQPNAKAAV